MGQRREQPSPETTHPGGRLHAGLGFVLVVIFLDVFGFGLVIPTLPKLIEELVGGDVGKASRLYGLLLGLYSLMQFGFSPLLGYLSDRFGRRPVILTALLGSAVDYLLLALAPSVGWFFLGRAISGISGASIAAASAYVADVTPTTRRAQAYGLMGAMFGLGFVIGPALGGVLGHYHLRLPFVTAAGLTFLNWLYGLWIMPESLPQERRRNFRLVQANPFRVFATLRCHPVVQGLGLAFFLSYLGQMSLNSVWVLYADYRYGWSVREIGMSLALVGIMAMVVKGGLVRWVVPWLGEARAIHWGLLIGIFTYLGYGLAPQGWMIYPLIIVGSLAGITSPAAQSLISRHTPPNRQGAVQGALSSLISLAGVLAPPVATWLYGVFIGAYAPWEMPGAPIFLGALLLTGALIVSNHTLRMARLFRSPSHAPSRSSQPAPPPSS